MHHKLILPILLVLFLVSCKKTDLVQKDYQTLGTSARDYLTAAPYTALDVEISYMPGFEPDATVISNVQLFLNTYLNKPGGVTITRKQISAGNKAVYTINEIAALERSVRSRFTSGNTLTTHILVVDGDYDKEKVLGTSYWNTSICIFGKTVNSSSGGLGQVSRTNLYTTVLEHEFGHLLGLVDQGTPMVTNHKTQGAHCTNTRCLMYYQIETGITVGGTPPSLEANCIQDLKANGGK